MSRSVWCSVYSSSYTYTQSFGKTRGVLLASSICAKVKSEFSPKKSESTQGVNFMITTVSVAPLGPEWAVPKGRSSWHGLSQAHHSWDHVPPRMLIHIPFSSWQETWKESWWPCYTKGWNTRSQKFPVIPVLPVYIKWPKSSISPYQEPENSRLVAKESWGFTVFPTKLGNCFCGDPTIQGQKPLQLCLWTYLGSPSYIHNTRDGKKSSGHGSLIPLEPALC